ncbi:MAG: cytochrome c [Rhodospirillaceae bacterium]|nr:cytochrome c [Rhodospirillaceae bacterium]MDE0619510.1 cytochrome c [Rhodospirillaceae bacterium]MXY39042.1 cytochrome c [Rhodospirillaceae bacterium]MYF86066.1 cytochrome c [Rhodospirillaceae bacterium]MYH36475.1 cytochrome c [Rhodospirillaceae bacterium]
MSLKQSAILLVLAGALVAGGYFLFGASDRRATPEAATEAGGAPMVEIVLPDALSDRAQSGKRLFDENCVTCHGPNAAGQEELGPPLVHIIYEPGHHGDESFQRAVALGVRAHHWRFGNMAPVEGLSRDDVALIVAYIRELQRANGIN